MSNKRRVDTCDECGKTKVIAAQDLCETCYQRVRREAKKRAIKRQSVEDDPNHISQAFDRHTSAVKETHTRLGSSFQSLLKACALAKLGQEDTDQVFQIF